MNYLNHFIQKYQNPSGPIHFDLSSSAYWLNGVGGANGIRTRVLKIPQDYYINEDGTISYGGLTVPVLTDEKGNNYFELDVSNLLQGSYKGKTLLRYPIRNLLEIPKKEESQHIVKDEKGLITFSKPKYHTTLVYYPDGRLLAKRIWLEGKPGIAYITGDGMDLNDYMSQYKWYTGDKDSDFFSFMEGYETGQDWYIKSGNYRKPGKVYLAKYPISQVLELNSSDSDSGTHYMQTTPKEVDTVLTKFKKFLGFKGGGYLQFFNK